MVLLTILKKLREKEKEVKILLLGLDNAGKTTIWKKFIGQEINTVSPTLGFHIQTLEHNGYNLTFWDVGGQESLRPFWGNYFDKPDGLVWVVDSADKMRLNDCKEEFEKLIKDEKLSSVTLLVFANKADLPGALSCEEIRDVLGLQQIKTHHWNILSCSAIKGDNLVEGIDWIINDISSRLYLYE